MGDLPGALRALSSGWVLTSVADDEAVFFDGAMCAHLEGLEAGRAYEAYGEEFVTLTRPPGQRLATVATVNDLHFGETAAGHIEGMDVGPVMTSAPGATPYPEVMNSAAVIEIAACVPHAVLAKGDLTAVGTPEEYAAFEACYRLAFGDRLHVTRGNHDTQLPTPAFECPPVQRIEVPGATLALLDTSLPGHGGGRLTAEQMGWLDDVAAGATTPVLVFGHHPCWQPGSGDWVGEGAALDAVSSSAPVTLVARRASIAGYFAGHTHRNKVRRFAGSGAVPFVEVACVKDFPGSWAEYRIFEGGVLQVHRRLSSPEALAWSEKCRAMVFGLYPDYAFGAIEDRCFVLAASG